VTVSSLWLRLSNLWSEEDKRKHFYCSFVILFVCYFVMDLSLALIATGFIGLLKEIWDHYLGSGFCWRDMQANALGILAGWLIIIVFQAL